MNNEDLYYKIDDGVLRLSSDPDGKVPVSTRADDDLLYWPWYGNHDITKVMVEDRVTLPEDASGFFWTLTGVTEIEGLENLDTSQVENMYGMFDGCKSLTSLDLRSWDTSNVTCVYDMFGGCDFLSVRSDDPKIYDEAYPVEPDDPADPFLHPPIDGGPLEHANAPWGMYPSDLHDEIEVCTRRALLYYNEDYNKDSGTLSLSGVAKDGYRPLVVNYFTENNPKWPWTDTIDLITKVVVEDEIALTTCKDMFAGLEALTSIEGLGNLDTSKVTDMSQMFSGSYSITSLDLSSLDTHAVTDMGDMFSCCHGIRSVDLSGLDLSNVSNMSDMFYDCHSLQSLDLSSSILPKTADMSYMFEGCNSLETVTTNDNRIISTVPDNTKVVEPPARAGRDATPSLGDAIGQAASEALAADEGHAGHTGHDPR